MLSGAPGAVPRLPAPSGGGEPCQTGHVATLLMTSGRAAAVHEVLTAVLGRRLPRTPRGTYLVLHGALDPAARETAEPVPVVRRTFEDPTGTSGAGRPFRRVDMIIDDPLLDWVTIVTVRAATGHDAHHQRLVQRLVATCDALVLVTDGRFPYQSAELDVLGCAAARATPVFLAVAGADERWPEVAQVNRSVLATRFPHLVAQPWYPLSRTHSAVTDLRYAVHAWARRSAS